MLERIPAEFAERRPANAVTAALNGNFSLNNFLMSLTQYLDQQGLAVNQCLTSNGVGQSDWSPILDSTIQDIVGLVENTITKNDCKVQVEIDEDADDSDADDDSDSDTTGGGSVDPNDKTGPAGVTKARWVLNSQPLIYTVSFENEPTATLPAQQVVVTDKLDPAKVDLTTLSLGPVGFNTTFVTTPAGVNNYSTTVNLEPAQDLLVQIQGSLNADTGVVKWTFRSLDPATNLPPADPSVGFLPPDTAPPAGDGFVVFSVTPKKRAPNGTKVTNQATVVPSEVPNMGTWRKTRDAGVIESACATRRATRLLQTGVLIGALESKTSPAQNGDAYQSRAAADGRRGHRREQRFSGEAEGPAPC